MVKTLWPFNALLGVAALVLLGLMGEVILALRSSTPESRPAPTERRAAAPDPQTPSPGTRSAVPPLAEFAIILQKDAFRNPHAETVRRPVVQPPPLPPLPTLVGTIFVGEERKAFLSDGKRTDMYAVGQQVAGGRLARIEADRVVIERNETSAEVWLRASIQPVPAPASAGTTPPGTSSTEDPEPGQTPGRALNGAPEPGSVTPPAVPPSQKPQETGYRPTRQQRWEERMRQLLERRMRRQEQNQSG